MVAVGSFYPANVKGEKYQDGRWSDIPNAPVPKLNHYAAIFDAGNFYYFGGRDSNSILRLNAASWTWSNVGSLNQSNRQNHGVILIENTFMVLGGRGQDSFANEACHMNNDQFTCEEQTSVLEKYAFPLLFYVSPDYGVC